MSTAARESICSLSSFKALTACNASKFLANNATWGHRQTSHELHGAGTSQEGGVEPCTLQGPRFVIPVIQKQNSPNTKQPICTVATDVLIWL